MIYARPTDTMRAARRLVRPLAIQSVKAWMLVDADSAGNFLADRFRKIHGKPKRHLRAIR